MAISSNIFISSNYNLKNDTIFVELSGNSDGMRFDVNFGEPNSLVVSVTGNQTIFHQYSSAGKFYIKYTSYNSNETQPIIVDSPVVILNGWTPFDVEKLRILNEEILILPYEINDVYVQPNEWGDADIFNSSIERLNENLDYLKSNTQIINTNSPTYFNGWIGKSNITENKFSYYTETQNKSLYQNPSSAVISDEILDISFAQNFLAILNKGEFQILSVNGSLSPVIFTNSNSISSILTRPVSIEFSDDAQSLFVVDSPQNKIYKFDLDYSKQLINTSFNIGGYGKLKDPTRFNSPSEIIYDASNVYILDYNNRCIKQFTDNLTWLHTYYSDSFETDTLNNFAINPLTEMVYVVGDSGTIYLFDKFGNDYAHIFKIPQITPTNQVVKMTFDEAGEFLYIVTTNNEIYKFTFDINFVGTVNIPNTLGLEYVSIKSGKNRSIYIVSKYSILVMQDLVELFKIGEGLNPYYWTSKQLKLNKDEFASDLNYNRCLLRMAQNLKSFRNILNAKFVINSNDIFNRFSFVPAFREELPIFHPDIEKETIGVGINELHIPAVFNREIKKLYIALYKLKEFLDVKNINSVEVPTTQTPTAIQYFNSQQSFTANCPSGSMGSGVTTNIAAGVVYSNISIDDANSIALNMAISQSIAALSCVSAESLTVWDGSSVVTRNFYIGGTLELPLTINGVLSSSSIFLYSNTDTPPSGPNELLSFYSNGQNYQAYVFPL